MKKIALLLLLCLLVGCAGNHHAWVNVDAPNKDGYSIYMNDRKVCESSSECRVDFGSIGNDVVLDARKDSVVYGKLIVKKETTVSYSGTGETSGANQSMRFTESLTRFDPLLGIAVGVIIVPVAIIDLLVPSVSKNFPKEVTIPIASPEVEPFAWDQPAKD